MTFYIYVFLRLYRFLALHVKLLNTEPVIVSGPVLLVVGRRMQVRCTHVEEGLHVVRVVTPWPGHAAAPVHVHNLRVAVISCSSHNFSATGCMPTFTQCFYYGNLFLWE